MPLFCVKKFGVSRYLTKIYMSAATLDLSVVALKHMHASVFKRHSAMLKHMHASIFKRRSTAVHSVGGYASLSENFQNVPEACLGPFLLF